jgi:hypothetical protein
MIKTNGAARAMYQELDFKKDVTEATCARKKDK